MSETHHVTSRFDTSFRLDCSALGQFGTAGPAVSASQVVQMYE